MNFHDLGFGNGFLYLTPKAQVTTEKIGKLNFLENKNLRVSKDIITNPQNKRNACISDEDLVSRIHQEPFYSTTARQSTQSKNTQGT